jgi:hypothetical protein
MFGEVLRATQLVVHKQVAKHIPNIAHGEKN